MYLGGVQNYCPFSGHPKDQGPYCTGDRKGNHQFDNPTCHIHANQNSNWLHVPVSFSRRAPRSSEPTALECGFAFFSGPLHASLVLGSRNDFL